MAEDKEIYPVPKDLFEGLMSYLRTRPLGETLDGYMALSQIQPVEMVSQDDKSETEGTDKPEGE